MHNMRRTICIIMVAVLAICTTNAQTGQDSYEEFKRQAQADYESFRSEAIDRYESFMEEAWQEYEVFAGRPRTTIPKLEIQPILTDKEKTETQADKQVHQVQKAEAKQTDAWFTFSPRKRDEEEVVPLMPMRDELQQTDAAGGNNKNVNISLYGLTLSLPALNVAPMNVSIVTKQGDDLGVIVAQQQQLILRLWKKLKSSNMASVMKSFETQVKGYRLDDWCKLKAVEAFASDWARNNENAKLVLVGFMMLDMKYDVRLAIMDNKVTLLLPFIQSVFEHDYMTFDNARFYIYPTHRGGALYTCRVADDWSGSGFNLVVNPGYLLPRDNQEFLVEHDSISIKGYVNKNLIRLQAEYPHTDLPSHASSVADDSLHISIIEQLRSQLTGMETEEAANALLHLVQNGFEYKTDREQFGEGVEKPFFFEELLYYPYCDCEDRSVFFAYLVHELLGLDVLLVEYPGHECTAVAFSEPPTSWNSAFDYKGQRYYICDPTFINGDVGLCMPQFKYTNPKSQEWYPIKEVN